MGTRGLTKVIDKVGEIKIAQYGQWDHYPTGQGSTIVHFLQRLRNNPADFDKFMKRLEQVRFMSSRDKQAVKKFQKSLGCEGGWMTSEQAQTFNERFPFLTRNHGGKIMEVLLDAPDDSDFMLTDSRNYMYDGFDCEWAYCVDFQKEELHIYEDGSRLVKTYSFNELPSDEDLSDLEDFLADNND